MIRRHHVTDTTRSEAVFSLCETYRYSLTRIWDENGKRLVFIMLNPSKADERSNDPTVERCQRRAEALGFGAFRVVNLFAWRDTEPRRLRRAKAPIGPENDAVLHEAAQWGDVVLAAWGVHGAHLDQGRKVEALLRQGDQALLCLGATKAGHPRHPLYVSYKTQPALWG